MTQMVSEIEARFWKRLSVATLLILCLAMAWEFYESFNRHLLFPNSDFESGNLENWIPEGDAFLRQPTLGDNPLYRGKDPVGLQGKYWIGTFEDRPNRDTPKGQWRGDEATGTLRSKPFTIAEGYIGFLIGAGNGTAETSVSLEVEGTERLITFGEGARSGSEAMSRRIWDVRAFVGKSAVIIVKDLARESWGHINLDDFRYMSHQ